MCCKNRSNSYVAGKKTHKLSWIITFYFRYVFGLVANRIECIPSVAERKKSPLRPFWLHKRSVDLTISLESLYLPCFILPFRIDHCIQSGLFSGNFIKLSGEDLPLPLCGRRRPNGNDRGAKVRRECGCTITQR